MDFYKLWFANLDISYKVKKEIYTNYSEEKCIFYDRKNIYLRKKAVDKKIDNILNDINASIKNIVEKEDIKVVGIKDSDYPKNLKELENPPIYLFYKGNINILNEKNNIAIVGSRRCTSYGAEVTKIVSKNISNNNLNIVSGGALGIDSIAHKTALENKGTTSIVLGCGIDVIYPKYNKNIFKEVLKDGCILSEFPIGTPPISYNFPIRNRIISGLSRAIIIVEGTNKSGSMITAKYGLEQGKDILAVPGSIFSSMSEGPNSLIKDGALVLDSMEELNSYFNFSKIGEKNESIVDGIKERILKFLKDGPMHIDEIIRHIDVDTSDIYRLLFEMQFDNKIISFSGNYYGKIN